VHLLCLAGGFFAQRNLLELIDEPLGSNDVALVSLPVPIRPLGGIPAVLMFDVIGHSGVLSLARRFIAAMCVTHPDGSFSQEVKPDFGSFFKPP